LIERDSDVNVCRACTGPLGPWCGGGAGVGSYVFMLNDPSVNEYTYDWHSVFLRYCDGMAFTGNASSPLLLDDGQKLWFRGYEILRATFDSLTRSKHRLGDATDVNLVTRSLTEGICTGKTGQLGGF